MNLNLYPPALLLAGVFLVGLCIGSFLNVVIHRLPRMMERGWRRDVSDALRQWSDEPGLAAERARLSACADALDAVDREQQPGAYNLVVPNSHCPGCGHVIRPWENIPLLSYAALKGRCSGCGTRISPRYPAVELVTGLLSLAAAWHFGMTLALAGALLLLWSLVALTMIDFDTQLLPDSITLPLLWLGLLFNTTQTFVPLSEAVVGAVAGYLSLWTVYWAFKLLTGKEGMGYGDFKLLAALGAWLGWLQLPVIILAASLSGVLVALIQMAGRRLGWGQRFAFGPYLAAGGVLALFFGRDLLRWYLGF